MWPWTNRDKKKIKAQEDEVNNGPDRQIKKEQKDMASVEKDSNNANDVIDAAKIRQDLRIKELNALGAHTDATRIKEKADEVTIKARIQTISEYILEHIDNGKFKHELCMSSYAHSVERRLLRRELESLKKMPPFGNELVIKLENDEEAHKYFSNNYARQETFKYFMSKGFKVEVRMRWTDKEKAKTEMCYIIRW